MFCISSFSINLRKEVADGLRIYFDFVLKDYLLYKQEMEQASILLSPDYLKNTVAYTGGITEKQYVLLNTLYVYGEQCSFLIYQFS